MGMTCIQDTGAMTPFYKYFFDRITALVPQKVFSYLQTPVNTSISHELSRDPKNKNGQETYSLAVRRDPAGTCSLVLIRTG